MRIGFLGPGGTFTEVAVDRFIEERQLQGASKLPYDAISDVLKALDHGLVDLAVVPLTNTLAGDYKETISGLEHYRPTTVHSITLPIVLAIGIYFDSSPGQITEIRSKDTALKECAEYLQRKFPRADRVAVSSTAVAMREVMEGRLQKVAAIGSEGGLRQYGLKVIETGIENPVRNETEFLLLKKADEVNDGHASSSSAEDATDGRSRMPS